MSAIIGGLIPKIEGFQPIPNAVMIPFMEVQSAALAYGFGLNYEFGKRKIRSMSNEQFNSLTSEQIAAMSAEHSEILLDSLIQAVPKVMPVQHEIFKQYVEIEKAKVKQNVELIKWMAVYAKEGLDDATAHLLGGHLHRVDPDQTFFDPNDTTKDFAPETGAPPAATKPKTPPVAKRRDLKNPLDKLMKLVRIGNRPVWSEILNKTKSGHQWLTTLKWYRSVIDSGFKGYNANQQKQFIGSLWLVSTLLHKHTGKWY